MSNIHVKSIATYAPQFLGYDNSVLAIVQGERLIFDHVHIVFVISLHIITFIQLFLKELH